MNDWSAFVEGKITGIVLHEDGEVVDIILNSRSGNAYKLTAAKVEQMTVLEMRRQNIIDRISIWDSSSDVNKFKGRLCLMLYGAQEEDSRYAEIVQKTLESLRCGKAVFLEIDPAYGALILLLAEDLRLEAI